MYVKIGRPKMQSVREGIEDFGHNLFGGDYHVFIYENDSNDCTVSMPCHAMLCRACHPVLGQRVLLACVKQVPWLVRVVGDQ